VVKFVFYPSKLKKQPFFANNFKIQEGQAPLPHLPTPMTLSVLNPVFANSSSLGSQKLSPLLILASGQNFFPNLTQAY